MEAENKKDQTLEDVFEQLDEVVKKSYCIIATSEKALYANILLQKGVI